MEDHERARFDQIGKECLRKAMRIVFYDSLTKPFMEVLGVGVLCLAIAAGANMLLHQETSFLGIHMCDRPLSLTSLLVFYALLIGATDPARKLSGIYSSIQGGIAAADRVFPLLDKQPAISDPLSPRPMSIPIHRLTFNHVNFEYVAGQPVLRDINLKIKFGETLAIVGANGCGKTTLVNLLPRFIDPVSGTVQIDGIDLQDFKIRDLRRLIAFVTQHTLLFDDTVENNIRYGSPQATVHEVTNAAKRAMAHQFITQELESGYQTVIGPGGSFLSGGQRQRISLARAILRDPEILILDEATNQIDLKSEQLIRQALEVFLRERSAIIITHRMSTLSLADRVVVMDAGQIIDVGAHEDLISRCAIYQDLNQSQFRESA